MIHQNPTRRQRDQARLITFEKVLEAYLKKKRATGATVTRFRDGKIRLVWKDKIEGCGEDLKKLANAMKFAITLRPGPGFADFYPPSYRYPGFTEGYA